jgi:hypothetical protein
MKKIIFIIYIIFISNNASSFEKFQTEPYCQGNFESYEDLSNY